MQRIAAIVLAAGHSTRMGSPKPFVRLADGRTFLESVVDSIRASGVVDLRVVTNPAHRELYNASESMRDLLRVVNPRPDDGMLSSLELGVDSLDGAFDGVLATIVDAPRIAALTFASVCGAFRDDPARVCVATWKDAPGHPVLWPKAVLRELFRWRGPDGARGFLAAHADLVRTVAVEDPAVVEDIDTPEDLARAFSRAQSPRCRSGASSST